MKKSRKRNAIVLALIVLLIATAIGYAAFASQLEITGSATAYGDWDVHFENASITKNDANNSVQITDGGNAATTGDGLDVAVQLDYPGDTATVSVNIVNDGSVAAVLKGLTVTAEDDDNSTPLTVTNKNTATYGALQMSLNASGYTDATGSETTIAASSSQAYTLTFTWDPTVTTSQDLHALFTVTMDFEQPTV